jgi:enterochelin esterase family protein
MLMKPMRLSRFTSSFVFLALLSSASLPAWSAEGYSENPGTEGNGNYTIGADYKIAPDLTDQGNPKGKLFEFAMPLADSQIFRGDDTTLDPRTRVRKERNIFV